MVGVPVIYRGLESIYVKESQICFIDGERSRLLYRGYSIEDLARHSTYEEVACLLLDGRLPSSRRLEEFRDTLARHRSLPPVAARVIEALGPEAHPMDVMRTAVSALGVLDGERSVDPGRERRRAVRAIAQSATAAAHLHRVRSGQAPLDPREDLGHAANFLYMLTGAEPGPEDARAADVLLILHAEHEINASTFACMVAASTRANLFAAMTAGLAALAGPLHGGANESALRAILQVGTPDRAARYVSEVLDRGERIPGFGHRVYKNFDPRYRVLKEMGAILAAKKGKERLFETATEIEKRALERLASANIFPNVDFYSGLVMHLLGIPTYLFTPIFAVGRTAGWAAHILEQRDNNRLIRPKAYYTGAMDRAYVPLEQREPASRSAKIPAGGQAADRGPR